MPTIIWTGNQEPAKQVSTVQITANDVTTTYILTVGDRTVSTIGGASANATASALADAWNASSTEYFTAVLASSATDTVTLTAVEEEVPFVTTSSKTGGAGTIGAVTETTEPTGPHHWEDSNNWDGGVTPGNGDDVIIANSSTNIMWDLELLSAVTFASLTIRKSYTGKIGLDHAVFAINSDGSGGVSGLTEYRPTYLKMGATVVTLGECFCPGNPAGSQRLQLDFGTVVTTITVHSTNINSSEVGRSAVRIKAVHVDNKLFVRSAPGGVGIAADKPGEVSTFSEINISDKSSASKVEVGEGVTLTTYYQKGGTNFLRGAATITTVTVEGGFLTTEGDYTITTANQTGGTWFSNHVKTAGVPIATANLSGGVHDTLGSNVARTYTNVNMEKGPTTFKRDADILTVTTWIIESDDIHTIIVS